MLSPTERTAHRALAALTALCLTLSSRDAWAHGAGVATLLGGMLGAAPALLIGLVHGAFATQILPRAAQARCLVRVAGATVGAVVGAFALQGLAEMFLSRVWVFAAAVIDLGVYALAALPLTLALRAEGKVDTARTVFGASVGGAAVSALLTVAMFSR